MASGPEPGPRSRRAPQEEYPSAEGTWDLLNRPRWRQKVINWPGSVSQSGAIAAGKAGTNWLEEGEAFPLRSLKSGALRGLAGAPEAAAEPRRSPACPAVCRGERLALLPQGRYRCDDNERSVGCHAGVPSSHWLSVSCWTLVPS